MNPRKITIKKLEASGFEFKRHGARHDLYFNPKQSKQFQLNDTTLMKMI